MNRFTGATRCLPAALVIVIWVAGCQSVTTIRMYNGPDVPSDQLATLVVPWCIGLRTVDGSPAPSTLQNELRIVLKPGAHRLEARYVVIYPTIGSNSEKITSDYVPLAFTAEPGKTYTIGSKDPKSLEETRRYAAHVSLWIEGPQGAPIQAWAPTSVATNEATFGPAPHVENPAVPAHLLEAWDKASEQERKAFLDKVLQQHR